MVVISSRSLTSLGLFLTFATRLSAGINLLNPTILRRVSVKIATFLSFLLPLSVLSRAPAVAAERVPFITIDQGSRSGVRERKSLVIKNEAEWKSLWPNHVQPNVPAKELPRVEFGKEMIVVTFLGAQQAAALGWKTRGSMRLRKKVK